jgi:hypothetical protein
VLTYALRLALVALCLGNSALAQTRGKMITLSKEEILKGAGKEGKLVFATAHEETTVSHLINAFKKDTRLSKKFSFTPSAASRRGKRSSSI